MAIVTVPATVAPFAGEVILTGPGVAVEVGVGVDPPVEVAVGVRVGVATPVAVAVAVRVGVGVPPLATVTETESLPSSVPVLLKALAEMVWAPLGTEVEFQLKLKGGDDVK